ncbi:hypothetical protein like AT4G03965 [Hibiscus trionum]|uniref:RING-type domain-containing protein n=1 Tax=Hibiscus trionum TaxID=183268 RepID=A0A9W7MRK3_HIBTR|nr:hypothetical protein like AT4G03965 [Hibiscus trionum]
MSQLSALLQEREARTILRFHREKKMNGVDRERRSWRSFRQRLGFKVMGCCGATSTWGFGSMPTRDEDGAVEVEEGADPSHNPDPGCTCINPAPVSSGSGMNRTPLRGLLEEEEEMRSDSMCCVCMGSKKEAAFIPCGHTFCRMCSRELWLNRGCCPLCNHSILEILDIY